MKAFNANVFTLITTYLGYLILVLVGKIRDLFGRLSGKSRYASELNPSGTMVPGWERFYTRRLFNRIQDCWARPLVGRPSTWIELAPREFTENHRSMVTTWKGRVRKVLNLGSYNYLGFADEDWERNCGEFVRDGLRRLGTAGTMGPVSAAGVSVDQKELEKEVAGFVGKEDAVIFGTGYATNAWTLARLVGPGSLIVSDALNHTSIVNGCRASGAKTVTFLHNDAESLYDVVVKEMFSTADGPKYKNVLVVVEGLYSMEGHICNLKAISKVCKELKCFLYVDEAHSIGALGATGRGICELAGVDTGDVDLLMGTFTKSFGGLGGYVTASRKVCDVLRLHLARDGSCRSAMSPVVCAQVRRSLFILRETDLGKLKLARLKTNAQFFREELKKMGCTVLGDDDSPIIPVMLYHPAKIAAFSRECLSRGLAVVVVGSPAVPLEGARARFCVSASHDRKDLVWALREIRQVAIMLNLRYEKSWFG